MMMGKVSVCQKETCTHQFSIPPGQCDTHVVLQVSVQRRVIFGREEVEALSAHTPHSLFVNIPELGQRLAQWNFHSTPRESQAAPRPIKTLSTISTHPGDPLTCAVPFG